MKKILLIAIVLLAQLIAKSQILEKTDVSEKTDWWGDVEGYLNQQANFTLELANVALLQNPPAVNESMQRKMALVMIDNVLHEEKAAARPAVQSFFKQRIELAIKEICSTRVKKGAVIWKLYDHAFVVKTPTVTIGFDIQRGLPGVEGFILSKELLAKLISNIDLLFVSHYHNDHADPWIAEMFLNQLKPVLTPPDVWKELPFYDKVTHPERKAGFKQTVQLAGKGISLQYVVYPGHQGDRILNNVTLVFTPEGMSFSHTGDQSNLEDFSWIDRVREDFQVDVLMTNSWSVYPEFRLAKGFRPRLILPGHENEMGHTIDHREPYWLNYARLGDPAVFPWVQMAWGEKYAYFPK